MVENEVDNRGKKEYFINDIEPISKPIYSSLKRLFDVLFASVALIVLFIPMIIVTILVKFDSPGPVIFRQKRVGKDGKEFVMYKFRTMRVDAEKNGPQWADDNDQRCTRIGHFLRKVRLDELPQMINVLKGEMSIVGPRPERQYFYDLFETYIHGFYCRTKVTPGITGWAQINGGYDLKPEEKIIYDIQYINDRSLLMDMKCIFLTVKTIFTREGSR